MGLHESALHDLARFVESLNETQVRTGWHIESDGAVRFELRDGDGDRVALLRWVEDDDDSRYEVEGVEP